MRGRVLDHECAPPLPAQHQPLGRQLADGLARRALAHAELGGDLELVGNQLAGLPSPERMRSTSCSRTCA